MKATIDKTFDVAQPIDQVWNFLSDPNKVVTCVPGASITEQVDDKNYKGQVAMKFGPVGVKYNGEISIDTLDEANHKMVLKGRGLDSKGKGSADMVMNGILTETDAGTQVQYTMDVSITGMLAQFGSRLITDVTDRVVNQFIDNFKSKLSGEDTGSESGDNAVSATSMMGSMIKDKLFGKKDS